MTHAYTTRDLEMQEHYGFKLRLVPAGAKVLITGVSHSAGNLMLVANADVCDSIPLGFLTLEEPCITVQKM